MKKKGVLLKSFLSFLISSVILCAIMLSATAASVTDATYPVGDTVVAPANNESDGSDQVVKDSPDSVEEDDSLEGLGVLFLSMFLVGFGALSFKLFSDRISNRELIILIFVLIFVLLLAMLVLYSIISGGGANEGASTASACIKEYNVFMEGI